MTFLFVILSAAKNLRLLDIAIAAMISSLRSSE
jgi:hypothetical protein